MDKYKIVSNIIDSAILFTKARQLELREVYKNYSAIEFAKEFQTLTLNLGRQVGHTTYIAKNAVHFDIILTHNNQMKKYIEGKLSDVIVPVMTYKNSGYVTPVNTVWVDGASHIEDINAIYEKHVGTANLFVLLG